MSQSPSRFDRFRLQVVLSNVIVNVTISCRSLVFGQSRKVSAGFTSVSSLAVAAFDLVYCSLSVLQFVFVLYIYLVSSRRKVVIGLPACNMYIVRL